jgi:hypothetical protein
MFRCCSSRAASCTPIIRRKTFKGIFSMEKKMTVVRARRILGKLAVKLSDDDVQYMLDTMSLLVDENLAYNGSKESEMSNDETIPTTK